MSQAAAEVLINTHADASVQRIYGIVGDSLNPVTDAIRRGDKIRWVHVRHEETAAFAAGAEAQLTGQLAVCAGSCGPGNLSTRARHRAAGDTACGRRPGPPRPHNRTSISR